MAGIHGNALNVRRAATLGKRCHINGRPNTNRGTFMLKSSTLLEMNFTPLTDLA